MSVTDTPPNDAVPPEIFFTPEQAARRREELKRFGNVVTIPRLRFIGMTLLAVVGVPLHNAFIEHAFFFQKVLIFFLVVELYCTASWLLLYLYHDKLRRIELGDVFLYLDLFILAGAVYATGGERSWFFWLPLMRVADQSVNGFKTSASFVIASTIIFIGLWFYLASVALHPIDLGSQIAKTAFVAVAGFYVAMTSRASERVRSKLSSTMRFARQAIVRLKDSAEALRAAREQAEQASQAKSEFLARISHELRRPATTVIGFSQLLEMTELTPKQRDYVMRILRSGQDLGVMIDEVMDLADIQSGAVVLHQQDVDLADVVEESLTAVWPLAAARSVRLISAEDAGDPLMVRADRRGLRRVVLNVVTHVIRYSGSEDRVVVSWDRSGSNVSLRVRDSGPGVVAENVEEILSSDGHPEEELLRLQQLGLGLAFAKALTQAMGGKMGAELEIGAGTTYWVEIPLAGSGLRHEEERGNAQSAAVFR